MKSMQARFAVEALEIDEVIGTWLLQEWKRQFSVGSEERDKEYTSIEDYLKFRIVDAGAE
jgi:ophiobolin F synthase